MPPSGGTGQPCLLVTILKVGTSWRGQLANRLEELGSKSEVDHFRVQIWRLVLIAAMRTRADSTRSAGSEFHGLLLVVLLNVDIHRLLQSLRQIRNLQLPVGISKGFKLEVFYAKQAIPDTSVDLCGVDRFGIGASHGD